MSKIRLWLVEDDARFRSAFRQLIEAGSDFDLELVCESFEELEEAVEANPAPPAPDLIVMDLNLPGIQGIEAIRVLRERYHGVAITVLSSLDTPEAVFAALRAGASGYVVKGSRSSTVLSALHEAHRGGTYFSPGVARHVIGHFRLSSDVVEPLSSREVEVLAALADGMSQSAIAEALFLSPHTVDSHVRNIYRKLHVRTAAQAVAKGVRGGLV